MDEVVKIMARGLIAMPGEVRKKLNLKEGDIVKLEVKENEIVIRKEERLYDLKGSLKGAKVQEKSFAQILQEELSKKHREG
ncbi:AbrB/MazE/SpoVT family DNA-binding domain-containing protein [Thermocrinis sp.]|jgi:AbrB family looped-hinge helix DNA binding protein|uniref:AbrB/MazE/SpoVT family DNA-binding domain-containing protein n=1 Tax=Thermocrinis sp. TaxID=2024383 RepID=UPI003C03D8C7